MPLSFAVMASLGVLCLALAAPAVAATRYLAFGDSITHGLGDGEVDCEGFSGGYPEILGARLEFLGVDANFVVRGVCGELTSEGITRIVDELDLVHPDVALIMEGTNDLTNRSMSVETIRFNLSTMVDAAFGRFAVAVLAPPIPRNPETSNSDNTRTQELAELLAEDAAEQDLLLADTFFGLIDVEDLFATYYTDPFHPNTLGYVLLADLFVPPAQRAASRAVSSEPCIEGAATLCLSKGDRFKVEVDWRDFEGNTGHGQAVSNTTDTGFFWFFGPQNLELMIKVLDGRPLNGHFWVFYGALSNVEYRITVTDSRTGRVKRYLNPSGKLASVGDTSAFSAAADLP